MITETTTTNTNTNTNSPDWGVAYHRGELLGWVGYRGELDGDVDGFLDGHYATRQDALAAMYTDME
jgi:hypothetical protein